ncbi:hypothetical protein L218DRAFT_1006665 [Marasmius fiardii PR-910]|nr:hypothetical protein L218DRAFT_1006665 [Marasmius fiardii PR-910]
MDRTLKFKYNPGSLKKDVDLVMTFEPPTDETMTHEQSRVAWKVAHLYKGNGNTGTFDVNYSARLGFSVAEVDSGNIIDPQLPVEVKLGEMTTLTDNPRDWSKPSKISGTLIKATNKTEMFQDIVVGTVTSDRHGFIDVAPTFLFKVGAGNTVEANFHPKLMMYANAGYQENALMEADETSPLLWEQNLAELPKTSTWIFTEEAQGKYKITRD